MSKHARRARDDFRRPSRHQPTPAPEPRLPPPLSAWAPLLTLRPIVGRAWSERIADWLEREDRHA